MALVLMLVLQGINEEMGMYFHSHTSVSELSFTIYTLIVGAWVAWAGYLRHQLLVLNLGLALVGLLAICRFFDIAATMDDVISLGIGEPDFVTPPPVLNAGLESIRRGETAYT